MKKVLGYGFKIVSESLSEALRTYTYDGIHGLNESKEEVIADIKRLKKVKGISKSAKPKIFKVVIETLD